MSKKKSFVVALYIVLSRHPASGYVLPKDVTVPYVISANHRREDIHRVATVTIEQAYISRVPHRNLAFSVERLERQSRTDSKTKNKSRSKHDAQTFSTSLHVSSPSVCMLFLWS